jgi:homoserine kinase
VVVIPDTELRTAEARNALPQTVPHAEAALNSTRAALLGHALVDRLDLLMVATEDLLHQEYRRTVMPQSLQLVDELRASHVPAVVSGAGPTVLALTTRASAAAVASDISGRVPPAWRTEVLSIDHHGVTARYERLQPGP